MSVWDSRPKILREWSDLNEHSLPDAKKRRARVGDALNRSKGARKARLAELFGSTHESVKRLEARRTRVGSIIDKILASEKKRKR